MFEFVSATRMTENDFWIKSALGMSLNRLSNTGSWEAQISYENKTGLPSLYNDAIHSDRDSEILIFIHDDVWLDDFFIFNRILEGLKKYDILGVAGNVKRVPGQVSWAFMDANFNTGDKDNESGRVAHGPNPFGSVLDIGKTPAECEILDGVIFVARKQQLIESTVQFDPIFDFHFYDIDFCRKARKNGLRLGTWPISITHQSTGEFGSDRWFENYSKYMNKWGE
jgi:hypothetical protein